MDDTTIDLDQTGEAILIFKLSDAALGAAADVEGGPARAFSFNFLSSFFSVR